MAALTSISGIGQHKAEVLKQHGFSSVAAIAGASVEQIQAVPGFGVIRATEIIEAAQRLFKEQDAAQKQVAKQKMPPYQVSGLGQGTFNGPVDKDCRGSKGFDDQSNITGWRVVQNERNEGQLYLKRLL